MRHRVTDLSRRFTFVGGENTSANASFLRTLAVLLALSALGANAQQGPERGFTRIANEGQAFVVEGRRLVRYGANNAWTEQEVSGQAYCTNQFFGRDPAMGIKKWCKARSIDPQTTRTVMLEPKAQSVQLETTAQRLADEGQTFTLPGERTVRYGVGERWIERSISGSAHCSNAYFGEDPAPGIKKRCELTAGPMVTAERPKATNRTDTSEPAAARTASVTNRRPQSARPNQTPQPWGSPRDRLRFFVSGHSLTDDPYAAQVAALANNLIGAAAANYNQQIVIGSPIRIRTGMPRDVSGYSSGKNRPFGERLDIRQEFVTGATIGGERYGALVITENHNLLQNMEWESTVKQVRHFHEQIVASNPEARTYLHASWWNIDKSNPEAWQDAERAMAPVWSCVVSRINLSLSAEGRPDRVWPLPTSLALVHLVDQALDGRIAGVSAASPRATLDRIFSDEVHLTRIGIYFMSLVTYAALFERSPEGAPPVQGVTQEQASALQATAWSFVSSFYSGYRDLSLDECNNTWLPPACERYWTERKRPEQIQACRSLFRSSNRNNPLFYDATTDNGFWFPVKPK